MAGIEKNVGSQKWRIFVFDRTTNAPKTGDAANITAKIAIDHGAATALTDVNPVEIEDGYYLFDLSQAETNGAVLDLYPESSSSNAQAVGCPATVYTVPAGFSAGTGAVGVAASVTGAVGSVTGAVGSVTANVNAVLINGNHGGGAATITAAFTGSLSGSVNSVATGVTLAASQHVIVDSGTITAYTGNTPQTGDSFALIGATGSGLTSLAMPGDEMDLISAPNATALQAAADALLNRNVAGGSSTGRLVKHAFAKLRNKWDIYDNGGTPTMRIYDTDDTTVIYEEALSTDVSTSDVVTGADPTT